MLVGGPLCDVVVLVVAVVGAAAVAVVCQLVSQYKYLFALFFLYALKCVVSKKLGQCCDLTLS